MATTKVSKFVLEDNTVTFEKLALAEGAAGQVISVGENNQLLLTDRFTQEEIEDITAALLLRGNHTNISISYISSSNQLDIVAHGAVRSVNGEIGDVVLTTDNISEGTENLYFTDARADARITVANIGDLNNVDTTGISTGDFLLYDGNNFLPVAFEEEVNTYVDTRVSLANVQDLANVDGSDTLNPGDILFYDNGDSEFKFINLGDEINSYFDIRFATKNTGHLAEGSNLYYTDDRVDARVDIAITNLINGADAAFDTLKEIQDAMATDTELADAINALVIPSDLSDLTDTSSLLFSRDYNDLINKPNLFSGSYNDLTDIPVSVVSYNDLTDLPVLFSGSYDDLTNKPTLVVSYNDLTDLPVLFSGSYNDLTDKPTIPSVPTNISAFTNDSGYLTTHQDLSTYALKTELFSGSYNDLTDVPALVVSYNDLTDTPTIPSVAGLASETYVNIAISNLVNGADAAFDTLKEIQDAMATDTELASAINNLVIPEDVSDLTDSTNLFFSGSYNDLTDVPALVVSYDDLTDLPTNVSAFNNDAGYLTDDTMLTDYGLITDSSVYGNGSNISSSITNVSSFNNDAGYISSTNTPVSTFNNDAGYLSSVSINDLTDVNISNVSLADNQFLRWNGTDSWINETINIPTKVSELVNDIGFVTSQTAGSNYMVTDADNTVSGSQFPSADNTYDLGTSTHQWRTIYGHEVEATYADLAERYASDAPYEPGTVVVFGGEAEVTTTTLDTDVSIAGVVSTNPALKLNSSAGNNQTHPYIALKGRVPCKVIGPVRKGELLVSSSTPGYARSCGKLDMGLAVFAKALENDLSEGEKIIEVAVI